MQTGTILHSVAGYAVLAVAVLPVLATAYATIRAYRSTTRPWRPTRWAGAAVLAFVALDAGLLGAMSLHGLYFPSLLVPLLMLATVRLGLGITWLLAGSVARRRKEPARTVSGLALFWALQALLLAAVVDAFWIEPFALTTSTISLPAAGLSRPLRILQISDLHVERITPRERAVLEQVEALQPDLIVLTGDYVNLASLQDLVAQREARALLAQLHAPLGVYAIAGTVDRPWIMDNLFTGLEITVLDDQVVYLPPEQGGLYIVGVSNRGYERDVAALQHVMAQVPAEAYALLLYHTPDLAPEAAAAGVDLYLAGHTHGGQIRLPFYGAITTAARYGKTYEAGLYQVGPMALYVSRGIGMEGFVFTPRVRFLCPPEVVLLELQQPPPSPTLGCISLYQLPMLRPSSEPRRAQRTQSIF